MKKTNLKIYQIYDNPDELLYYDKIEYHHPGLLLTLYQQGDVSKEFILNKKNNYIHNAEDAYLFAKYVLKGRWPEAEKVILTNVNCTSQYARDVIRGRWPEAEKVILTDKWHSIFYARDVIHGRWPEAEKNIIKNLYLSFIYAREVINGRWLEMEKYLKIHTTLFNQYNEFLKSIGIDPI